MNRLQRHTTASSMERHRSVSLFIDHTLKISPDEMMDLVKAEQSRDIPPMGTSTLIGSIALSLYRQQTMNKNAESAILAAGIHDIYTIISTLIDSHPHMNDTEILEIMSHEKTIDTIALIALQGHNTSPSVYAKNNLMRTGSISHDGAYIINDPGLHIGAKGCPAAGFSRTGQQEGSVHPTIPFRQLIPWATRTYLLSVEYQEQKEDLIALTLEK